MLIEDSLTKVHNKFAFRLAKNTTIIIKKHTKVDHTTTKTDSMALFWLWGNQMVS